MDSVSPGQHEVSGWYPHDRCRIARPNDHLAAPACWNLNVLSIASITPPAPSIRPWRRPDSAPPMAHMSACEVGSMAAIRPRRLITRPSYSPLHNGAADALHRPYPVSLDIYAPSVTADGMPPPEPPSRGPPPPCARPGSSPTMRPVPRVKDEAATPAPITSGQPKTGG